MSDLKTIAAGQLEKKGNEVNRNKLTNSLRMRRSRVLKTICGLDEAGRGALAGPLVVAAVVMPLGFDFGEVTPRTVVRDSKKLSKQQRERLFRIIEKHSLLIKIEVISAQEINNNGINWAEIESFRRLISTISADQYVVDGRWHLPDLGNRASLVKCVIGADESIPSVLGAGIVAKIKRDEIMRELDLYYPVYGWITNTGHGTKRHLEAIRNYGICDHHRKQFVTTALGKLECFHGRCHRQSK